MSGAGDKGERGSLVELSLPGGVVADERDDIERAVITYAPIQTSVSGGCSGLPEKPRRPLNSRPRNVRGGTGSVARATSLSGISLSGISANYRTRRDPLSRN